MKQSIKSMIEVLQAYKDGKKIEYRIVGNTQWSATDDPQWQFSNCEYRIAPEPKKKVKYRCFTDGNALIWIAEHKPDPYNWTRVPSEDKEILI